MSELHPALAFLQQQAPASRALAADTLLMDVEGTAVEIAVVPNGGAAFFAAGATRLGYRCGAGLSEPARLRLRGALLALRDRLAAGYVATPDAPLPADGGWTDALRGDALAPWRDWATRQYRAAIERGGRAACAGLPDCLDLRMRPPLPPPWPALREPPRAGACARCGRARGCAAAHDRDDATDVLEPLRHADAASAELAALRLLAAEAAVPIAAALDAYALLHAACGDRAADGALGLEFSLRLPAGAPRPDRLRFVSYYPLARSDAERREIHRGRAAAAQRLAAHWLTPPAQGVLDAWLASAADTQPATLGLSIGVELDAAGARLQVYAHPEPNEAALRFAAAAVAIAGGSPADVPAAGDPPVLVGIALAAGRPPALKLYRHRTWDGRGETGLLPDGLGALAPFNPGWGLAVQEHVAGRAAWVKWDFPVPTHYQAYGHFVESFWRQLGGRDGSRPAWLSGEQFSPWPTWASLGRGGGVLYFQAR
ncbi:hypothetical protein KF840_16135 [bacterium]|nr:hypothetical protein [bacterium]